MSEPDALEQAVIEKLTNALKYRSAAILTRAEAAWILQRLPKATDGN